MTIARGRFVARRRIDWFAPAAALAAAAFVWFELRLPAPAELMQADSRTYLDFAAIRTAGYPLFLRLVEQLPGGLQLVPAIQLGLYGFAAWLLALAFRHLTESRLAGVLLLALLLGNAQVTRLSFMIMTESLFLTCLMLVLALACRLVTVPRWQTLALASLVAGIAVLIRPAAYAVLPALPLLAWWGWRDGMSRRETVAAAMYPCLLVLGLGMVAYHAEHGLWRTESFLGSNLYGKAAAIVDGTEMGPGPGPDQDTLRWMAATVAPDRAVIDKAPTRFDRFRLLVPYYDIWRWHTVYDGLPARTDTQRGDTAALDAAMLRLSVEVIRAKPLAYLDDVALNYAALWTLPDAMTHAELAGFRGFIASLGTLPDLATYPAWHQERNDLVVWALRGLMGWAFLFTLWWAWRAARARREAPPLVRLGLLAAVLVHAIFLETALLQAGMPRYVWATWPLLALLVAAGAVEALRAFRR